MEASNHSPAEYRASFLRLGLEPSAEPDEIRTRYRELADIAHPDRGGSDELMASIQSAYRLAYEYATIKRNEQGVALREASDLQKQRLSRRTDAERVRREVLRHQTEHLEHTKRQAGVAALLGAGVTAFIALLKALGLEWLPSSVRLGLVGLWGAISALLGLIAWRASARAARIEGALEHASEELGDRGSYLRLLAELDDRARLGGDWTRDALGAAIEQWTPAARDPEPTGLSQLLLARTPESVPLKQLATVTGSADFADLIISRGLEREFLGERRAPGGTGTQPRYAPR